MFQEHAKISEKFGRNWLKGGLLTTKRNLIKFTFCMVNLDVVENV